MAKVEIKVKPEILNWALSQTSEGQLDEELMDHVEAWINGTKSPTFRQIEKFSKKTNIPLGYFFLDTPPDEPVDLLEYRTVDSLQLSNPSRDLIDTIYEMENVQEWMKAYRQDSGFDPLPFVGSIQGEKSVKSAANQMREALEIKAAWFETVRNAREAFSYFRQKLEDCGIVVMINGIVGQNTHRTLNINEFRAFAIVDEWAPLIFINGTDSENGKLFSLLHESAHIWAGESDLFNMSQEGTSAVSKLETFCNAVSSELLVPEHMFLKQWYDSKDNDTYEKIVTLAKTFCCSEVVIARKALDHQEINQKIYQDVVKTATDHFNRTREKTKNKGGIFYKTVETRLDRNFILALCDSISTGRTAYTEAYYLTKLNQKTFSRVAKDFGGVG